MTCEQDERAASEVIGYLLIFGILSMILVLSMLAFNEIHDRAEVAVVAVEAESVAQRVASAVVTAALFAEGHEVTTSTYLQPLDLPGQLEGHSYRVHLEAANTAAGTSDCTPCPSPVECTRPVQVRVCLIGLDPGEVTAPLFSADASTTFDVCVDDVLGGAITVQFGQDPDTLDYCIFLEATS